MRMAPDELGYHRPVQQAAIPPQVERIIATACPGAVVAPWDPAPLMDPYWGPYHRCLTGYATDDRVRFGASSGGGVTALAIHALRTGLVDRVLHIKADPERPTRNVLTVSRTPEEVLAGAGSRYAASSPLQQISEALDAGGAMAFIGKPCDASALRQLAKVDPRVDVHVPLVLSFFCAGLPSARGADRILRTLGVDPAEVVSFRYRGNGWPGTASATTRDGSSASMSYDESWGGHLAGEVQFRCKVCPDAVGGVADVACADAWYETPEGGPSFDERPGRSLILTRTARGEAVLQSAIDAGHIAVQPMDPERIQYIQASQALRKRVLSARLAALAITLQPQPKIRGNLTVQASRRAGKVELLRNLLGTTRRVVLRRR
ncbi:MAG: Coenzyme F420 hydrogenase/dehydrogenase, beta subunit C-terminal domain [Proteobacteria bacterium]|nr:Coenzyme F420 hydrogenase/dehydrogenase, beta subunit C-terminal domain [Pseudomonadota bacterium]